MMTTACGLWQIWSDGNEKLDAYIITPLIAARKSLRKAAVAPDAEAEAVSDCRLVLLLEVQP